MIRQIKPVLTKVLASLLAGTMLLSGMPVLAADDAKTEDVYTETSSVSNPVYDADTDTTTWSYVYFGSYPMSEVTGDALTEEILNADYDSNGDAVVNGHKYRRLLRTAASYSSTENSESYYNWNGRTYAYFVYEPIRWRVLQSDGDTLFLLADEALDCRMYNQGDGKVTWETSAVRSWLNGYDGYDVEGYSFLSAAFTQQEQEAILTTHVTDSDNPFNGISGGSDTDDRVFLLSVREAMNPEYGFPDDLISYTTTRRIAPTAYASAMGVWLGTYNDECYGNAFWLLRSPGAYQQAVSIVYNYGHVYQDGYYANERCYGICPAMIISADSDLWTVEEPEILYGDMSQDGEVTVDDAQDALQAALLLTEADLDEKLRADVDGDGAVTLTDARLILCYALKINTAFPVESIDTTLPEQEAYVYTPDEVTYPEQQETEASGVIWIAADSIAAYHSKSGEQPLYGWGELIGSYFDSNVSVQNKAVSGSSTKSFAETSGYSTMISQMSEGDYMLISFGHNDERAATSLYADPFGGTDVRGSFQWNLKTYYIDPALEKGVQPVLITPVVRRYFENSTFVAPQLHTAYAEAMIALSEEYAAQGIYVPVIDLHQMMTELYTELGEEGTKLLHGLSGSTYDNTHLSETGATIVCEYLVERFEALGLDICRYLLSSED